MVTRKLEAGSLGGQGARETAGQDAAIGAVLRAEAALGRTSRPTTPEEQGYHVESRAADGLPLFITVRGREAHSDTFLVTRSELGVARNTGDRHVLALVDGDRVRYVRQAFARVPSPSFGTSIVTFPWNVYFERGRVPW